MSSLPELVAARELGMESAVASWITNYTAPLASRGINHEEVCRMGAAGSASLEKILMRLVERLGSGG
jgi:purine nucleoside phosphorylase